MEYDGGSAYSQFQNRPIYDGRRVQKAFERDTIDYNAACVEHMQNRVFMRGDGRDRILLPPNYKRTVELDLPQSWWDAPETSFATRHVKAARNKRAGASSPIFVVLWTPQGRRLLTGQSSGEVMMWNGLTFNFESTMQAHQAATRTMVWSHKEQWLVTGDDEGKIRYFQSSLNKVMEFAAHYRDEGVNGMPQMSPVREISMAPTDNKLASGSDDSTVKIWDFKTCQAEHVLKSLGSEVKTVQWHPSRGLVASGGKDNQVRLWDPRLGRLLCTIDAHKKDVSQLRWNKNGNWLLTAGRDNLCRLWDIRMMKELQKFKAHTAEVTSITWHPIHENFFVSGDKSGRLIHWLADQPELQEDVPNAHDNHIFSLAWHPLGHLLVSGSNDQTAKFWTRQHPGDDESTRYAGPPQRNQSYLQGFSKDDNAPQVNRAKGERISFVAGETLIPGQGAVLPEDAFSALARPLPEEPPPAVQGIIDGPSTSRLPLPRRDAGVAAPPPPPPPPRVENSSQGSTRPVPSRTMPPSGPSRTMPPSRSTSSRPYSRPLPAGGATVAALRAQAAAKRSTASASQHTPTAQPAEIKIAQLLQLAQQAGMTPQELQQAVAGLNPQQLQEFKAMASKIGN